ncbi:MAG: HAD family hydrolase [Hyphomicrobiaceae bacterium]
MSRLHVVFDLDDTLYPEHEFAYSGFRAVGRWAEERWGVQGIAEDMAAMLDAGHLGALFKATFEKHRPDHSDEDFAELREIYRTHDPEILLFDDARWALEHFATLGPLGLITDGTTEMQATKVRALDIAEYFSEIVFTHEGGGRDYHKPHPWSYQHMEQQLGGTGDRFVYVGDNPAKDFITPNARGWLSVQVRRERSIHDQTKSVDGGAPQFVVHSLHELADLLDQAK